MLKYFERIVSVAIVALLMVGCAAEALENPDYPKPPGDVTDNKPVTPIKRRPIVHDRLERPRFTFVELNIFDNILSLRGDVLRSCSDVCVRNVTMGKECHVVVCDSVDCVNIPIDVVDGEYEVEVSDGTTVYYERFEIAL